MIPELLALDFGDDAGHFEGNYDFVAIMEEGGLPVFSDIRAAITSLDTFVSYCIGSAAHGRNTACVERGDSQYGD